MINIYVQADCGCCDFIIKFVSVENAAKAFRENHLQNGASITDDAGQAHEGIGTFCGFATSQKT